VAYHCVSPGSLNTLNGTETTELSVPHLPSGFTRPARACFRLDEPAARDRIVESFGKLPLYFVENHGQLDERVAYYIQGSDKTIYFSPTA